MEGGRVGGGGEGGVGVDKGKRDRTKRVVEGRRGREEGGDGERGRRLGVGEGEEGRRGREGGWGGRVKDNK